MSKKKHKLHPQPATRSNKWHMPTAAAFFMMLMLSSLFLLVVILTIGATTAAAVDYAVIETTTARRRSLLFASTAFIHSTGSSSSTGTTLLKVPWSNTQQQHGDTTNSHSRRAYTYAGVSTINMSSLSSSTPLKNTNRKQTSSDMDSRSSVSSSTARTKGNKQVHDRRPPKPKRQPQQQPQPQQQQQQQQKQQQGRNKNSPIISSSSSNNTNQNNKSKRKLKVPNLETQLQYSRKGHCVLRQHLSPTLIQTLQRQLVEYTQRDDVALQAWKQKVEVVSSSKSLAEKCRSVQDCQLALQRLGCTEQESSLPFLQYFNTWRHVPLVLDIVHSGLAETAAMLMDTPTIRLYQDALFWKRAHDGPTPWHVDARMAPFDTAHFITFWIPLQDISVSSATSGDGDGDGSALIFCSKSHRDIALPFWNDYQHRHVDAKSPWNHLEERYGNDVNNDDSNLVDYMPLTMGDITAHDGWTLHCADPIATSTHRNKNNSSNNNNKDRMALAISFVDARAVIRDTSSKSNNNKADNEDSWSYRDWIDEVPVRIPYFRHELVPIVYPPNF
jgi:Phytanoyl-CoA dioxygenase (PhyH)